MSVEQGLLILFLLLPFILGTWWFFVKFVFRSLKEYITTKERIRMIYSDPISAAIHSATIIAAVAYLVGVAFSRYV